MSVAIDSGRVFDLARKIAADAAAKYGNEFWQVHDTHIRLAREQLAEAAPAAPLRKVVTASDEELARKAAAAQFARRDPNSRDIVPGRRIEFGSVPFEGGRVMVAHDQGADEVIIHGVRAPLSHLDQDLRHAFVAASAAYLDHVEDQEEQVTARALVGLVVEAVARRHDFVGAEVRRRVQAQRYD